MIRAILVDDEPLALQLFSHKLRTFEDLEVIKTFANPLLLLEGLQQLSFNVAFLDIEMPGINGIDLAEHILSVHPSVCIVFVSAYRDYAIEAFELNSIDYILKPLTDERLQKTILRLRQHLLATPAQQPGLVPYEELKIQCFAEFTVYSNGQPVKWKTAKVKELFAFFITHHRTFINRDVLIDILWPDTEYDKAKIQLHTALSHLRKTLATIGHPKVITFANQSYCLDLSNFQCDAINIEHLLIKHSKITPDNVQLFEEAINQYKGDYMEQEGYEWSHIHSMNMRQSLYQLIERTIDYYDLIGEAKNKLFHLTRLFQLDPYSEQVLQKLLEHYIQSGNRTEAIKVYHDFKARVMEELGISPNHSTDALYKQVLFSDQL
ncbi:response regulator [Sporosarcina aquimarina]|uniref:response regulator n=1 Tax=Sporosarcina aquimarina TaxID=114975 RepID=UPI001C8DF9F2|nr:response regulator [Sporosarcina aquimarina]MBY0223608.1 response regulator [Sporosarcina aquimarina]